MRALPPVAKLATVALLTVAAAGASRAQVVSDSGTDASNPTFDDLVRLREVAELSVSPEGRWVAYTTRARFHADTGREDEGIVLFDRRSGTARVLAAPGHPRALQWSTRGDVLGFLATSEGRDRLWRYQARSDKRSQTVIEPDSIGGSVLAYAWSSAGDSVAYIAAESRAAVAKGDSATTRPPQGVVLFHDSPGNFTGTISPAYQRDFAGAYVAVTDVNGGTPRVVARHVISQKFRPTIGWSRSGTLLVGGAPIGVGWMDQIALAPLYTVDLSDGVPRKIGPERLSRALPAWSPSGRRIASLEYHTYADGGAHQQTFALRIEDPTRSGARTTSNFDAYGAPSPFPPLWGADDKSVYVARYENGSSRLYAVDLGSRRWRAITPESLFVSRYAVTQGGKSILAVLESATHPQRLYSIDPATGKLSEPILEIDSIPRLILGRVEQVAWPSSDGRFTVHGFLIKPPAYDPSHRYPLIVLLHGGPGALFTNSFVDLNFWPQGHLPPQWFALAGYVVLMPNPRGDGSYGDAYETAILGDWGPGPFADISAGVDSLIAAGLVDSTAMGIAGASYGGYLSAFAITHTHRFAAASIDDGPMDLAMDYGSNYAFHAQWFKFFFGGTPWTKSAVYAAQSPITFVENVTTPVLMRYGGEGATDDDVRQAYNLSQGFEFYAGLRDAGAPVQFVLHPDQGHGIRDWVLYKDWVDRNLRWYDFWLRHEGPTPAFVPE